jgi:N-acetylglucosaminyldiphosphoundecaprenol N-acetyl-beta-D-mannosaminyltransferase
MIAKRKLFSVAYSITDYGAASDVILEKALAKESFGVSALAVHGLIESVKHKPFRECLEKINLIVPDGQPIRWALNSFYDVDLKDRVAGPILTQHVLAKANLYHLRVYLYGSVPATLKKLQVYIKKHYPNVVICGVHADRFRDATSEEDAADIQKINASGANLVLVGRGCPRQEKWVAAHIGSIQAPMMAIGAAFDFFAGNMKRAPHWMQDAGLEWLYNLFQNPKRTWRRVLTTNPHFIYLFFLCKLGFRKVQF